MHLQIFQTLKLNIFNCCLLHNICNIIANRLQYIDNIVKDI